MWRHISRFLEDFQRVVNKFWDVLEKARSAETGFTLRHNLHFALTVAAFSKCTKNDKIALEMISIKMGRKS